MRRYQIHFLLAAVLTLCAAALLLFFYYIPAQASLKFGPPAAHLSISERIDYSTRLLSYGDVLTTPLNPFASAQAFVIEPGESVFSVASRLQSDGLISNAQAFVDYLVYTGLDLTIQSGRYQLSAAQSIIEIAHEMQDATPQDVTFGILPGWRVEEIAASLPTSGLDISPEAFLSAAQTPSAALWFDPPTGMEGYFFPDTYILPRSATVEDLLDAAARNFTQRLTDDLQSGFAAQGLRIHQAVILASIVQREAVRIEEAPMIASVYLNRLAIGMKLDADPTVQYALGYNSMQNTWWTNPLGGADLQIDSPYNTYRYSGLPPGPISNPGMEALRAVAFPANSPYYYFRAACDGSGVHVFAVTLEEQIANGCE